MLTPLRSLLVVASLGLAVAGCGTDTANNVAAPSAPAKSVSIALSWTPNTDYTGVYVAQQQGLYRKAGIKLKVIPYASTMPETLVSAGRADFAFSYQAGVAYARSGGSDLVAVFAPHQRDTYAIGVRANRADIKSPKDLDGKIYAGFGSPDEGPELKSVIRHDGGQGKFRTVTLNTSAYQAVYAGDADFTIPVTTWEGVEAESVGKPMKYFRLEDYGFPEQYASLIAAKGTWLKANSDLARRFIAATSEGYAWAAKNPDKAAALLVAANPKTFKSPTVVAKSQRMLVDGGYMTTPDGKVGVQSAERWNKYGSFLFSNGLLTGPDGKPLKTEPDWTSYWSNNYLPGSGG